jgi:hypothetical protein
MGFDARVIGCDDMRGIRQVPSAAFAAIAATRG